MRRKLVFLNLLLATLVAAAGWQIRERWLEAKKREAEVLARAVHPPPAPALPAVKEPEAVQATQYLDVAAKDLFAKDRNPTVIIEAPKPVPDPPLPTVQGVMDLGFGATIFMSEPGKQQKGYKEGDKVGEYKLVKATRTDLEFEWDGKTFKKTVAELKAKPAQVAASTQQGQNSTGAPAPEQVTLNYRVTSDEEMKKAQKKDAASTWIDTGGVNHACAPGDAASAGTVVNGYRKVTRPSMFGTTCFWEPVR